MSASRSAVAAARSHRSHRLHLQRPPAGQQPARPAWLVLLVPLANAAGPLPEPELIYAADSLPEARDCAAECLPSVLVAGLGRIRIEQAPGAAVAGKGGAR